MLGLVAELAEINLFVKKKIVYIKIPLFLNFIRASITIILFNKTIMQVV